MTRTVGYQTTPSLGQFCREKQKMNSFRGGMLAAVACIALAGCHFPSLSEHTAKAPTGQVVATVGRHKITVDDLRSELGNATFADETARKNAEQLAIRNLIAKVILADAARQRGVQKTHEFMVQKKLAIDTVLAQTLQLKIISEVPKVSVSEVKGFVNAHPDIFSQRKIFLVEQIRTGRLSDPSVIKALGPLKDLDSIEGVLKKGGIAYQRDVVTLDAVGADPRIVDRIARMPPHEVFVVPNSEGLSINQVREAKVQPLLGEAAFDYARKLMMRQRTQEAVNRSFTDIMAKAQDKVKINTDYAPAPPMPLITSSRGPTDTPGAR
jgi:peptidyl-prolyl cis-trans isomerase C